MYYYVLCVIDLVAMATMKTKYMVNFMNKSKKSEEKVYSISHFYNIDHRLTTLVCMSRSISHLFKTDVSAVTFPDGICTKCFDFFIRSHSSNHYLSL